MKQIWTLALLLLLAGCGAAGTELVSLMPTAAASVFLPSAYNCACSCEPTPTPTPGPPITPTVTIYNCEGEIATTSWLTSTFGEVMWSEGSLAELRCSEGPAVLVVHVEDLEGKPVENATVILYWPDAPWLPAELQSCNLERGVYGPTNANGDIGFGLGPGSYYYPPAGGPHVMWVAGGGSCLAGLGMLGGTNHEHLDSAWILDGKATDAERGYSRGAVMYEAEVDGRRMWVIRVP